MRKHPENSEKHGFWEPFWRFSCLKCFVCIHKTVLSGPEVIKKNLCSTQLSMKFSQVINVKMQTNVGILTFLSMPFYDYMNLKNVEFLDVFNTDEHLKFHAQLSWSWNFFNNLGHWTLVLLSNKHSLTLMCVVLSVLTTMVMSGPWVHLTTLFQCRLRPPKL